MSRILVIPGPFVPYNDTVSLLTYKHLRLSSKEKDVVAIEGKADPSLEAELKEDSCFKTFRVKYICKYDEIIASMEKKNVIQGIFNIIRYILAAVKSFDAKEHTVVYSSSVPCFTHVAAFLIKKMHPEVRWIASFSDPIYKSPYKHDPESFKEYSLLGKIGFYVYIWIYMNGWYEKIAMKHADHIVYICNEQKEFMNGNYSNYEELNKKALVVPLNYIPEWRMYQSLEKSVSFQSEKKVFSHFGRIYGLRTIDEFLIAIKQLKNEINGFEKLFVFEQFGQLIDRYHKMIQSLNIEDCVQIHDKISYQEVADCMMKSDCLCLFDTIVPEECLQPYLPSKSLEYLLMKKEILVVSTKKSPAYRIFSDLGYECCRANVDEIKNQIRRILLEKRKEYDYSLKEFENAHAVKELVDVLDK